jgi:hypothetical protein
MATRTKRPTKYQIGRIAETRPELLNALVAYFVMEWRGIVMAKPPHGKDQTGLASMIPDYVRWWGVDRCVHYLLRSPKNRTVKTRGYLSEWLEENSQVD